MMVKSCEQNLDLVSNQFIKDLQMIDTGSASTNPIQYIVDKWSSPSLWLWVKSVDGAVLATSPQLAQLPDAVLVEWVDLPSTMPTPEEYRIDDQRVVVLAQIVTLADGTPLELFLVQDMTEMKQLWQDTSLLLGLTAVLVLPGLMGAAVVIVGRSLQPLHHLKQWDVASAATEEMPIRPEDLPEEVRELVTVCDRLSTQLLKTGEWQRDLTIQLSHNLRTPLTLVYGYLQSVARRGDNLTDAQQEALAIAQDEAEHIINLLQTMLNDARSDAISTDPRSSSPSSSYPSQGAYDSEPPHSAG